MNSLRFGLAAIGLAMLLAAAPGEADAGANSGGGFYDRSNINVAHVNPRPAPVSTGYIRAWDKRSRS
jgi:hypothetical protein